VRAEAYHKNSARVYTPLTEAENAEFVSDEDRQDARESRRSDALDILADMAVIREQIQVRAPPAGPTIDLTESEFASISACTFMLHLSAVHLCCARSCGLHTIVGADSHTRMLLKGRGTVHAFHFKLIAGQKVTHASLVDPQKLAVRHHHKPQFIGIHWSRLRRAAPLWHVHRCIDNSYPWMEVCI
jgi:hypothetical protein